MEVKDLAGLSEPIKELISRCFDVLGMKQKPGQIVLEAKAEAEAAVIKARSDVEVQKIKAIGGVEVSSERQRAIDRILHQGEKEQRNIESIIMKALPEVKEGARPKDIEDDWLHNFFDKCRLISNDEMQFLWAKVLAGESQVPNSFSKRTVNLLQTLDKKDAEDFQSLCRFTVRLNGNRPLILDPSDKIYESQGITLRCLYNFQSMGLLTISEVGFNIPSWAMFYVHYGAENFQVKVGVPENYTRKFNLGLDTGKIFLNPVGEELSSLCQLTPVEGFVDYLKKKWADAGHEIIPFEVG